VSADTGIGVPQLCWLKAPAQAENEGSAGDAPSPREFPLKSWVGFPKKSSDESSADVANRDLMEASLIQQDFSDNRTGLQLSRY